MDSPGQLCVLGAGPGGLRAAREGLRMGFEVTLVERHLIGGVCLNCGCIPTKHYLNGTAALALLKNAKAQKILDGTITADLRALKAKKERFIAGTRKMVEKRLREDGIHLVFGEGRISGPNRLTVTGPKDTASGGTQEIVWDKLILASGSQPASFPGLAADHIHVLDSTDILDIAETPESLIVVGAGAIGLEMADFLSRLGSRIILVEACARLAPSEDPEIGETLRKIYIGEGWTIHTGRPVAEAASLEAEAVLRFVDGEEIFASKILLAMGRKPNSAGLELEKLGVDAARPTVDACLRLAPDVYAVGDLNGKSLLAHAADDQGRYAAAHAAGTIQGDYAPPAMPACIYGQTEVLRVGPSCGELLQRENIEISRANLAGNPIAQGYCAPRGFIKVFWEAGRVVGINGLGHGLSHLTGLAATIVGRGWTSEDIHRIIWAHPTLDEALEAALTAPREAPAQEEIFTTER